MLAGAGKLARTAKRTMRSAADLADADRIELRETDFRMEAGGIQIVHADGNQRFAQCRREVILAIRLGHVGCRPSPNAVHFGVRQKSSQDRTAPFGVQKLLNTV